MQIKIKQCNQTPKQILAEMNRLSRAIEQAKKSPAGDTGPITGGGIKSR
jgi:hypothetical protein